MVQKIIQVGNSAAVTIPKGFVQELRLHVGQPVLIRYDEDEDVIKIYYRVKKVKNHSKIESLYKKNKLDPEFIAWSKKFIDENKELFKELANR